MPTELLPSTRVRSNVFAICDSPTLNIQACFDITVSRYAQVLLVSFDHLLSHAHVTKAACRNDSLEADSLSSELPVSYLHPVSFVLACMCIS